MFFPSTVASKCQNFFQAAEVPEACENCDDLPRSADAFRQEAPMEGGLAACEALCSSWLGLVCRDM